tara:strand:- start:315 stop:590 length:276 start_codon:yes stop_codon:yes gene_type:complete
MYEIKPLQRKNAKKIGVTIKPSTRKGKKIDVFKDGKKIASVGALGYGDYATFLKEKGREFADNRRRLYKIRHEKNRKKVGTNSYYADQILW